VLDLKTLSVYSPRRNTPSVGSEYLGNDPDIIMDHHGVEWVIFRS